MKKRALLFVNPISGMGESGRKVYPLCRRLGQDDWQTVVHVTRSRGDIPETIAREGNDYGLIVAMGGDGTLNETVTGIMQSGWKGRLGYIPSGSVNDFAASLRLPKSADQAAEIIAAGNTLDIDVGKFSDRYFAYVAAFGAFTEVAYSTPQQDKNDLGKVAYFLEGARALGNIPSYKISYEYDGKLVRDEITLGLVMNSRSVAGFQIGDSMGADLSDGLFEVLLIRSAQLGAEINNIIRALLTRNFDGKNLVFFRASKLRFSSDEPIPWTLDGEFGGAPHEVVIENLHSALSITVPQDKKGRQ